MIALIMFMAISATYPVATESDTTVVDIDGNVYQTVRIGHQLWMAENLRTTRYADGSEIANLQDPDAWNADTGGAWVNYDNDVVNDSIYGKLYNFIAVSNESGLCPVGWRVPTRDQYLELIDFLGGSDVAGGKMKTTGNLTSGTGIWREPNSGTTNESGFSALPGGNYSGSYKRFAELSTYARFWTSTPTGTTSFGRPTYRYISIGYAYPAIYEATDYGTFGASVRCVKEQVPPAITDELLIVRGVTNALISGYVSLDEEAIINETGVVWTMAPFAGAAVNGPTLEYYHGKHVTNGTDRGVNEVYLTSLSPASSFVARMYTTVTGPVETNGESRIDTAYSDPITFETLNPDSLENPATLMVRDIEGNDYPVTEINGIHWFKTNLRTSQYRDGTPLVKTTAENASEWYTGSSGKWVSLDFDSTKDATYGKLYNGFAVRSWRGICPAGWTVPSQEDFAVLRDSIGSYQVAGGPLKATGTLEEGTGLWKTPNTGATDSLGLSVIPAGVYKGSSTFERKTELAQLWSRTANSGIQYNVSFYNSAATFWLSYDEQRYGMSVRCMRTEAIDFPETVSVVTTEPSTLTQNLAVLSGSATPDGNGELSEWGIVLATHSTPTIQDVKLDANDPIHRSLLRNTNGGADSTGRILNPHNEFLIIATGLSSGTEYHARSYAILNEAVHYGNTVMFSTLSGTTEPVVDRDGNTYATIQIGDQLWMAENLRVSTFQDGTSIQDITKLDEYRDKLTPGWVPYPDTSYEVVFGKLYTWGVVDDITMNICPEGWHVPTREEWGELLDHLYRIKTYDSRGRSTGIINLKISDPVELMAPGPYVWSEQLEADNQSGFSLMPSGAWFETSGFYFTPDKAMSTGMDLLTELWINYRTGNPHRGSYYSIFNPSYDLSGAKYIGQMRLDGSQISARPIRCVQGEPTVGTEISIDHLKGTFAGLDIQSYHGYAYPQRRTLTIFEENEPSLYSSQPIYSEILTTLHYDWVGEIINNPQDKIIYNLDPDRAYTAVVNIAYQDSMIPSLSDTLEFTTPPVDTPLLEDFYGNTYMTMQAGDRLWMAENLRRPKGLGVLPWDHPSKKQKWPNMKAYMMDPINPRSFGGNIYNRLAVNDVKGICPAGWSVPTMDEWRELIDTFGGPQSAGPLLFGIESESGFMAIPNGNIGITSNQIMRHNPSSAYYWTSSVDSVDQQRPAVPLILNLDDPRCTNCSLVNEIKVDNPAIDRSLYGFNPSSFDAIGASVRCIQDVVLTIPELEPVEVSDISQTRATLDAALRYDGGGTLSEWGIYLSLDPEPGPEDRVLKAEVPGASDSLDSAQSFQVTADSLIPGAAYYARAFAENEVGTGVGEIVRFRTLADTTGVTVTDIDGNIYRTVQIGNQLWMKDNLRTSRYRNGNPIAHVPDSADWRALTFLDEEQTIGEGAWSHYRNDAENELPFGKLYNWYAVGHPSGLCPAGWIVPSKEDWDILSAYVGGNEVAGGALKAKGTLEAGTGLWLQPNEGATDSVGFSALPADFRYDDGDFSPTKGENAFFWSSTKENEYYAYSVQMNRYFSYLDIPSIQFGFGGSVRCLQDERSAPPLPDQPDTVQTDVAYQTPVDSQQGASAKVESHVDTTSVLSVELPPATTQQTQDGDGRPRVVDVLEITPLTKQRVLDLLGLNDQEEQTEEQSELLEYLSYRKSDIYDVRLYDDQGSHIEEPRFENPATICIQSPSSLDELIGGWSNVGFIRIETGPNGEYVLIPDPAYTSSDSEDTACMETNGFSLFALVPMDLTKVTEAPIKQSKGRAPGIELPSGTYTDSLFIVLSGVPTATIRYTVDGTTPTDTSNMYIEPVILRDAGTVTVNAKAFYESYAPSELISATYTLRIQNLEVPAARFPENGIVDVGVLTEFEWSSVSGADTYTLEIWEQVLFSEPLRFDGLTGSGITLTEPLKANTAYAWRVRAENSVGGSDWSVISTFETGTRTSSEMLNGHELPDKLTLHQNYPNPFNPSTTIRFGLPVATQVKLEIYNLLGQRVSTLSNNRLNAGWHQLTFDGGHLSSGVYVYRLSTAEGEAQIRMFTLIK